jgi:hypothetical protein
MSCHQFCECPKCTTFYDSCGNEIKNPHTGTFSESPERIIKSLQQQLVGTQARLSRAVEALEFYADEMNNVNGNNKWSTVVMDRGHRAREALKEVKGEV